MTETRMPFLSAPPPRLEVSRSELCEPPNDKMVLTHVAPPPASRQARDGWRGGGPQRPPARLWPEKRDTRPAGRRGGARTTDRRQTIARGRRPWKETCGRHPLQASAGPAP